MYASTYTQVVFGFDLDSECTASSLSHHALAFGRHELNKESDITDEDDEQQVTFASVKAMNELNLKFCIDASKIPDGFPVIKSFPLM